MKVSEKGKGMVVKLLCGMLAYELTVQRGKENSQVEMKIQGYHQRISSEASSTTLCIEHPEYLQEDFNFPPQSLSEFPFLG